MNLRQLREQTCNKLVPDDMENREAVVRLLERAYKYGWRDAMDRKKGTGLPSSCTEDDEPKGVKEANSDVVQPEKEFFEIVAKFPRFMSLDAPKGETVEMRYIDGNLRVSVYTDVKAEPVVAVEEDRQNWYKKDKVYIYRTMIPEMRKDSGHKL